MSGFSFLIYKISHGGGVPIQQCQDGILSIIPKGKSAGAAPTEHSGCCLSDEAGLVLDPGNNSHLFI